MMKHQPVGHYLPYNKLGRQTCEKSLRKRVWICLATFVEALNTITKEAYRESQDVRQSLATGRDSEGQCPNCNIPHPGICPCAWCDQPGHIAQDCMAHFADDSMRARFPKKEKVKRTSIKYYECHRCGGSHPFNIYCPNVRDPPVILGECRSCGTTTREHANDCQYVAIKDNIGLCTYCQAQDHRYADCPQRALDRGAVAREAKRNKKNKKRGKVKIVAGIITRAQESISGPVF